MKNLTWQNPEQLFVAQVLIKKVKLKCCGIKEYENSQDYIVYMKLPEEIDGQSALVLSHRAANLIKNDSSEIKNLIVSYANGCWGIISNNSTILYDNYDL